MIYREEFRGRGFTLTELLFAILIGMVLMGAAYLAMTSGQQSSTGVERKVAAQQDVRAALQTMGLELSMASYNPHYIPGIWQDIPNFGNADCSTSLEQTYRGIREATPTEIMVEMDLGETDKVGDEEGEIVRYAYRAEDQFINREPINCKNNGTERNPSAAAPFLGDDPSKGRPRTVRVINNNLEDPSRNIVNGHGTTAVFRYFDGRSDALHPLGQEIYPGEDPSVIPNIRRIDITLGVEADEVDPSTKRRKQMTYTTSVAVRNHALSQ